MANTLNGNLFLNLDQVGDQELVSILASGKNSRVERIVSHGQTSPEEFWYDQEEHEWVLLVRGQAQIEYQDRKAVDLNPGDYLLIPAHCPHRVSYTSLKEPTVWLAVFFQD